MKKDKLNNIKSSGYKTPDNYFESFEDRLFERLSDESPLADIKDSGFKVPTDYFDTLEENVLNKVQEKETRVVKLNTRKKLYYIAGIAASIILLMALLIGRGDSTEISVEMVETYLEESDLDSYELAQLLSDADLLEDDFTIATTPYEEENLESYLLDNIDVETFLE